MTCPLSPRESSGSQAERRRSRAAFSRRISGEERESREAFAIGSYADRGPIATIAVLVFRHRHGSLDDRRPRRISCRTLVYLSTPISAGLFPAALFALIHLFGSPGRSAAGREIAVPPERDSSPPRASSGRRKRGETRDKAAGKKRAAYGEEVADPARGWIRLYLEAIKIVPSCSPPDANKVVEARSRQLKTGIEPAGVSDAAEYVARQQVSGKQNVSRVTMRINETATQGGQAESRECVQRRKATSRLDTYPAIRIKLSTTGCLFCENSVTGS